MKQWQKIAYSILQTPFLKSKQFKYKITQAPKASYFTRLAFTFENLHDCMLWHLLKWENTPKGAYSSTSLVVLL